MDLFSSVMNLILKPPEDHRFIHLFCNSLIIKWLALNIHHLLQDASLKPSRGRGRAVSLEDAEEDENRSIRQKRAVTKGRKNRQAHGKSKDKGCQEQILSIQLQRYKTN
jgi:hypothetical protein